MGLYVVKMPDIGEGIAEVELVAWHVAVGDAVTEDQTLADVMTDKASVEIPSPVSGRVASLGGKVGEVLAVGSALISIETAAEAGAPTSAPAAAPAAPESTQSSSVAAPPAAGLAVRPAVEDKIGAAPDQAPTVARAPTNVPSSPARVLASPSVRQRALEAGVRLQYVTPTGRAGQVTHADLAAFIAGGGTASGGASAPTAHRPRGQDVQIPVIGLRRKIAQRMQEAKRRIPHFSYVEECDVTELESLRAQMNARWGDSRGRLNPLPFIARAVVLATAEFPQVNARFDDEAGLVTRSGAVHLGMATQTDAGLVVPVVRNAENLSVWQLAREVSRLADSARRGKATRDELQGSTITITSLGALGGIVSTPVINYPEVAIVGVNRIVERPMFRAGQVTARLLMNLSSSFDHRVVDGMDAARFIQAVRAYLEAPALLFVNEE
jgi:2-oxoisovalerate dehydrogenase E2 component (dihydrolipoyl transacylase)